LADKARRNRAVVSASTRAIGGLSVKANINLWESIVRAGLEYGAEVWGASGEWEEGELIMRESARRILRCTGKTTNGAVRGELGMWKLSTRRYYLMLKYWIGLLFLEATRLVKRVYDQSRIEYTVRNKNNWIKVIHRLAMKYDLMSVWNEEKNIRVRLEGGNIEAAKKFWIKKVFVNIQRVEEEEWKAEIARQPKLRTYSSFKTKLELEPYLLLDKCKKGRYLFTALRTGSNKLRIETGRWKRPKEPEKERVCMACMSGDIENERHFFLRCSTYDQLRDSLFRKIDLETGGVWRLKTLSPELQWRILMGGTRDKYHNIIADNVHSFVAQAMTMRSRI
jgi:hypothetical protein